MKKALVLGAGLVSKPLINYLLEHNVFVTVGSKDFLERTYIDNHPNAEAVEIDLDNNEQLNGLVATHDVTISLLPYVFHVKIAKLCIAHKKNMVTASYVSDEMNTLHKEASEAGVIILNEIGLDPGIDHMSAMQIIDRIKHDGGKVTSFISNCGGLPLWDSITTPFKYKFSWSPEGVVMAAKNSAKYLEGGQEVNIPNNKLFKFYKNYDLGQFGQYEVYPNRDSLKYIDVYQLNEIKTMYRGTFRNNGWCNLFTAMLEIDLLDETKTFDLNGKTYAEFMRLVLNDTSEAPLSDVVAHHLHINEDAQMINTLEWLGLFSDEPIGLESANAFQVICKRLKEKLQYAKGERDLVVLQHEFEAEYSHHTEKITSLLIAKGEKHGDSAMARTVGLPAAIATRLILEDKISLKGVQIPIDSSIYEPVLHELEEYGIKFLEKKVTIAEWR